MSGTSGAALYPWDLLSEGTSPPLSLHNSHPQADFLSELLPALPADS